MKPVLQHTGVDTVTKLVNARMEPVVILRMAVVTAHRDGKAHSVMNVFTQIF